MRRVLVAGLALGMLLWGSGAMAAPGGGGGGGGGGGATSKKTVTLSVATAQTVVEDTARSALVALTRTGSNVSRCASTVTVTTSDGTATATGDYASTVQAVTFNKGATSAEVSVPLVNDRVPESAENFTVTLSNASTSCKGVTTAIANAAQVVTVNDQDVVLTVPAGQHVSLTGLTLAGCNTLAATLRTPTGEVALGDNSSTQCAGPTPLPDNGWTNDTGQDAVVTLGLHDASCALTYFSDTTSIGYFGNPSDVNHALVASDGAGGWTVDINDGQGCGHEFSVPEAGAGNLHANVSIGAPPPPPWSGELVLKPGEKVDIAWNLHGCNTLEAWLVETVSGAQQKVLANDGNQCSLLGVNQGVVNDTGSDQVYVLRLTDLSCTGLYWSDGLGGMADHATTAGQNPMTADIVDAGGDCERTNTDYEPAVGAGNLSATLTVTAAPAP